MTYTNYYVKHGDIHLIPNMCKHVSKLQIGGFFYKYYQFGGKYVIISKNKKSLFKNKIQKKNLKTYQI